jgi:hypothetical protein
MDSTKIEAPPSDKSSLVTEVKTKYSNCNFSTRFAMRVGSSISNFPNDSAPNIEIPQNLHLRVHRAPNKRNAAVLFAKHSPRLGHFACTQTVGSLSNIFFSSSENAEY